MKGLRIIASIAFFIILCLCLSACGSPREETDMAFSTEVGGVLLNGTYTGTAIKQIPEGYGTFSYADDIIEINYSGTWENGVITGSSELQYNGMILDYSGNTYTGLYSGEAVNGLPDGQGLFIANLDEGFFEYNGQWKMGTISDNGYLKTSAYTVNFLDGITRIGEYDGDVLNGKASGEGTFTAQNDEGVIYTYEGEWTDGLWNGTGRAKWDSDQYYVQEGTFVDGDFMPTPLEYFITLGTLKEKSYIIPDDIKAFIGNNSKIFSDNDLSSYEGEIDTTFQYTAFSKNPSQYGPMIIKVSGLNVVQILEENYWGADHTFCILTDRDYNVYSVYLFGFCNDVYEGSTVSLTAVPLSYFTYPNTAGSSVWAIACAGISLE